MPEFHYDFGQMALGALKGLLRKAALPQGGYPSEYPKHPERRGAAAMLDAMSPSINEPTDGEAYEPQLPLAEGWDSLGCYIVKSEYEG